ncbi:MAG: Gfo/Idh/MocA family oxidoreductase [Pseudomonadota bacterium]
MKGLGQDEPLRVALVGAGRIGRLHAANVLARVDAHLVAVMDPDNAAAGAIAARHAGAAVYPSLADAIAAAGPHIVIIGSPTDTHVDLIEEAARARLAIFCEKPVDLAMPRVLGANKTLAAHPVPFMLGFHRRRDPAHQSARKTVAGGKIGRLVQMRVSSRDPAPPPLGYLKRSGGIFRDMMIHDIDQLRFQSGAEFTHVHAIGGRVIDPDTFAAADDFDVATATFWTADGLVAVIQNCRASPVGFEQRMELFGTEGALRIDSPGRAELTLESAEGRLGEPLHHHFPERYGDAYRAELADFIAAVRAGTQPAPGMNDAIRSLAMADAADQSARTGAIIEIDTVSASLEGTKPG